MPRAKLAARFLPTIGAIVAAGIFLTAQAAFADDGDEICSKSGTAQMFDALTKSWVETGQRCLPPGPDGPANGERKCGFAGYTLRYAAKSGVWKATQEHCNGSRPYVGWT